MSERKNKAIVWDKEVLEYTSKRMSELNPSRRATYSADQISAHPYILRRLDEIKKENSGSIQGDS